MQSVEHQKAHLDCKNLYSVPFPAELLEKVKSTGKNRWPLTSVCMPCIQKGQADHVPNPKAKKFKLNML